MIGAWPCQQGHALLLRRADTRGADDVMIITELLELCYAISGCYDYRRADIWLCLSIYVQRLLRQQCIATNVSAAMQM